MFTWFLNEARALGVREQAIPRGIEVKPTLGAEPTGRKLRNVQQTVAVGANKFGAVPGQKVSRRFSNPGRIGKHAKARWAALALILQDPAKAKQKAQKRKRELDVFAGHRPRSGNPISDVDGSQRNEWDNQHELPTKENPLSRPLGPAKMSGVTGIFAERESRRRRQCQQCRDERKQNEGNG